jgi:hypothetical protein
VRRSVSVVVALVSALMLAVLAAVSVAGPAESAPPRFRATITFDKNSHDQFDSRLIWRLYERQSDGGWKMTVTKTWRAGSGVPGKVGRNSCVTSKGWLPNGTYRVRQYNDYHGNVIKGRAFRLDDKACPSGHVRHNLFIHTEQGARSRQCPDRKGDQACRWEWPRINDYKSFGCIKLSPADLAELVRLYHRHFGAGVRYPKARVVLRVIA